MGIDIAYANDDLLEFQNESFGFFPGDPRFPVGVHYDYEVATEQIAIWGELDWAITETLRLHAGLRGEHFHYDYRVPLKIVIFLW